MGEKAKLTAEEHFSAEDYERFVGVVGYRRDDSGRIVFADDGDCAEVCGCYAPRIVDGDWRWSLDMLQDHSDGFARYGDEPDYGRCLALCLRCSIDECTRRLPKALDQLGTGPSWSTMYCVTFVARTPS